MATVALAIIASSRLACMSSETAIGVLRSIARNRYGNSPSPSLRLSVTMAPFGIPGYRRQRTTDQAVG